ALYSRIPKKEGLPHCYTLLWVDSASRIIIAEDVDWFISAELQDLRIDPEGYNVVSELMMHGPCGAVSMKAPCMKGDKCSKKFPKKFNQKTFFDENGHVHYQRRDTSVSATRNEFQLDNSYVVSYNRDLLLAFRAHINVEYCGWSMLIKYMFTYISKGTDRVFARVSRPIGESSTAATSSRQVIDKIQNYVEGRFICAHEAYWRILKFDIHRREPAVQILTVHLEDMQRITFRDQDRLKSALGLLDDDKEWEIAFEEACGSVTPEELWFLFSHILLYCDVADPSRLWKKYWKDMSYEIILSNCGKSLHAFGLPPPPQDLLAQLANRLLMEERNYNQEELVQLKDESLYLFMAMVELAKHFSGKPSLVAYVLKEGLYWQSHPQVLLLYFYHRVVPHIPDLNSLTEESLCRITKNTQLGKLLADTDLIIWDEAPMNDRRCFEALDRILRDIVDKPSSLFNGKSVLLGSDFRQTLSVKKGTSKIEVISSCISESALWPSFKVFMLKHNMRLARPDIGLEERSLVNSFAFWLLDIGDEKIGEPADEDPENTSWVHMPPAYCLPPDEQGLSNLIDFIYDQSTLHTPSTTTLQQKAIKTLLLLEKVVEEALEQALSLFEFRGFSPFNGRKVVHVVKWDQECSYPRDHFPLLGLEERDHDMVHKLEIIGQGEWLFGLDILKNPSEKHGIRESHFATLSRTYHSMSDYSMQDDSVCNGLRQLSMLAQDGIRVIFVTGEAYGIFTNDGVPPLEFIS
ncbi:DNA helicase, partial [Tanacetum coccineum]